eukprot:3627928-Prymnesium_polylepis.1
MSANSRGQPRGLPAPVDVIARVLRQRGQSEPSPALPKWRTASSDGANAMPRPSGRGGGYMGCVLTGVGGVGA